MGAFGLLDHHGEKTPPERLTSSHPCLDAFEVYRQGLTLEGSAGTLETGYGPCHLAVRRAGILEINGVEVRLVPHKLLPAPVFQCPGPCSKDVYRIYEIDGRWLCRRCGNLTCASKCRNRSIPNFARLLYFEKKTWRARDSLR
jgi:hypothetical protein